MLDTALTAANRAADADPPPARLRPPPARWTRRPSDVNALVADMEDLLRRTLGEDISIETSLSPDLWLTLVDTDELENAILNLAINARDAMPDGGRLTLDDAPTPGLNRRDTAPTPTRRSRPAITSCVAVADTGTGMPPEVAATRLRALLHDQGAGQGHRPGPRRWSTASSSSRAAMCRSKAQPGDGTVVTIWLPRTTKEAIMAVAPTVTSNP